MSYKEPGPLPSWKTVVNPGVYEATAPDGTVWRLRDAGPPPPDPHTAGYLLAPRDHPDLAEPVSGAHGLFHAFDIAGMRIAADAVRADPDGTRRQLDHGDGPEDECDV